MYFKSFYDEVGKDNVVFDIGANQGYFTVLCTQLLGAKGQVHAYELDPVPIPLANVSLQLNNYVCDVSLIQCAVSDKDGDLLSFSPHIGDNLTSNSILYKNHSNTKINSQTLSIDSYCNKQGIKPHFIKCDVEGAEYLALHGMKDTIMHNSPKFLIEIHPKQLRESNIKIEKIAKLILELSPSYNVYLVEDYRIKGRSCIKKVSLDDIVYNERPVVLYFKEN